MSFTAENDASMRDAAIVDRHLPEGYSADADVLTHSTQDLQESISNSDQQPEQSSLRLQGGDIHRDVFKIKARAMAPRRAATFHHPETTPLLAPDERSVPDQIQPGGFRRQFVQRQAQSRKLSFRNAPVASSFVAFLDLYGSFAGEDLADTDEDESAIDDGDEDRRTEYGEPSIQSRPLLGRRKSSKRFKREGDAGTTKTFFTLLKAFIGTGIMFLPKAFRNGGILFSSLTLIGVSLLTCLCFRLLLQCRKHCGGGGYGELGLEISGRRFRSLILSSIAMSQLGFVCTGIIFTAENLFSFLNAVTKDRPMPLNANALIAIQLVVLIPLALIRNISKLGPAALLADVFILIGLTYIWYYDISSLATNGMDSTVALFNPSHFTLTIGSAIFTFEGIGLILPIQSSMRQPEKFSYLLYLVMFIITCIFTSVGALCYATFGEDTKIQVISNFPQTSHLVNAVQFLYSMAVLVGNPVQLFPAVRIIETTLLGEKATGKKSATVKWKKNALRAGMTVLCTLVSLLGASDLDKFVALIGSFACVPLVYIYPPFLHYKRCATSRRERFGDAVLMAVGLVAMVYTTIVTLTQWIESKV